MISHISSEPTQNILSEKELPRCRAAAVDITLDTMVTTLVVANFPDDILDREKRNFCRGWEGFEHAVLKMHKVFIKFDCVDNVQNAICKIHRMVFDETVGVGQQRKLQAQIARHDFNPEKPAQIAERLFSAAASTAKDECWDTYGSKSSWTQWPWQQKETDLYAKRELPDATKGYDTKGKYDSCRKEGDREEYATRGSYNSMSEVNGTCDMRCVKHDITCPCCQHRLTLAFSAKCEILCQHEDIDSEEAGSSTSVKPCADATSVKPSVSTENAAREEPSSGNLIGYTQNKDGEFECNVCCKAWKKEWWCWSHLVSKEACHQNPEVKSAVHEFLGSNKLQPLPLQYRQPVDTTPAELDTECGS